MLPGDLQEATSYALANPHALTLMVIYTFLAYIAITFHMALVQEFGGITTGTGALLSPSYYPHIVLVSSSL